MKKLLTGLLYTIFFGFAVVLFVSCIILIINTARRTAETPSELKAVVIDARSETESYEPIHAAVSEGPYEGYRTVELHYGYDALDSQSKRYLYERIGDNIYSVSDDEDGSGHYRLARLRVTGEKLSEFDIREVVNAYIYDNPQVFWLENLFGYAYAGEDTIVEFYSVLSADACKDCIELFNKRVNEIVSSVSSHLSEYERERAVHDRLLEYCRYKTGVEVSSDGWQYFSAYGALVTGEAVCEGYAKSMQILLSKVGIPCLTIRGEADGVLHMWNVVELNNEWYHLDPTWDDNDKDGFIIYEYFNLHAEAIGKNHSINPDLAAVLAESSGEGTEVRYNFFVPMCTAKEMNYYMAEGILIEQFDAATNDKVISAIVDRVNKGEVYLPLRFGTAMTYAEYIDSLFYRSPYQFYYYVDHANEMLDSEQRIRRDSVSVLKNEAGLTLRIRLKMQS